MRITSYRLLVFLVFTSIIVGCSCINQSTNLETWAGEYSYEEKPIKASAGYSMVMDWTLSININADTSRAVLEVNGQQTYIKLLANVTGDTSAIAITYNSLIEGSNENLQNGDTLFILSKNENTLKTKWFALEPRLSGNPNKECNCFIRIKNSNR
jgi:hypothetical protein